MRAILFRLVVSLAILAPGLGHAAETDFPTWLAQLRTEALGRGIKQDTLDRSLAGVALIPRVIELDRRQPESTLTFAQYIERVINDRRVETARQMVVTHKDLLEQVSAKFGVQPRFIVALWGIETDFGRITGDFPIISALATLAYDGRRSSFFRGELMNALRMVDRGLAEPQRMRGSWAGAMGQSQFMPSSFWPMPSTMTATASPISGGRCPTSSPRSPITFPRAAGRATRPGADKSGFP